MASEASRTAPQRATPDEPERRGVVARTLSRFSRIPFVGRFLAAGVIFGPGMIAAFGYDVLMMRLRAQALGVSPESVGTDHFAWFPDQPRLAIGVGAGALLVLGLTTIIWGRFLRAIRARVRLFYVPTRWWGRLTVLAALALFAYGMAEPERLQALFQGSGGR